MQLGLFDIAGSYAEQRQTIYSQLRAMLENQKDNTQLIEE